MSPGPVERRRAAAVGSKLVFGFLCYSAGAAPYAWARVACALLALAEVSAGIILVYIASREAL